MGAALRTVHSYQGSNRLPLRCFTDLCFFSLSDHSQAPPSPFYCHCCYILARASSKHDTAPPVLFPQNSVLSQQCQSRVLTSVLQHTPSYKKALAPYFLRNKKANKKRDTTQQIISNKVKNHDKIQREGHRSIQEQWESAQEGHDLCPSKELSQRGQNNGKAQK